MRLGFDLLMLVAAIYLVAIVTAFVLFPETAKSQPPYLVFPAILMTALSIILHFYEKYTRKN